MAIMNRAIIIIYIFSKYFMEEKKSAKHKSPARIKMSVSIRNKNLLCQTMAIVTPYWLLKCETLTHIEFE